jgi:hypothetical protein
VLALFLLVSARSAGTELPPPVRTADDPQSEDLPHGDVPALGALMSFARES